MSAKRSILKNFYAIGDTVQTASNNPPAQVSGSMGASITGPTTIIDVHDQVCYRVSWTSSNAVGVISVQGSVDGTNFEDLTFTPALTQPASNNGSYLINLGLIPFIAIRVKYTRTSGTGTLTVRMSAKGT